MKSTKMTWALGLSCLFAAGLANAQQIGPDPTSTQLNATSGPFTVSTSSVSSLVTGFGGGTIYYPTTAGSYGVIAVCPGYTGTQSSIAWFARRLATHGFVTIAIDTNSTLDQPSSRATQLRAALNYVVNSSSSTVRSRVNGSIRGVAGHSMGGGGTLIASADDSTLRVGVPMTPWNTSSLAFRTIRVPQMIFGADGDTIAPYASHARPFYDAIPSTTSKAYGLLNSATHFTPNTTDERIGRYGVSFAKRFMYGDTRYSTFLTGTEHSLYANSLRFQTYLHNGPY
jgi:triacylglycerol lipase